VRSRRKIFVRAKKPSHAFVAPQRRLNLLQPLPPTIRAALVFAERNSKLAELLRPPQLRLALVNERGLDAAEFFEARQERSPAVSGRNPSTFALAGSPFTHSAWACFDSRVARLMMW
jgi:hypothetical protein